MGEHHSWRTGFYILGVVGIFLAVVLVALLRNNPVTIAEGRAEGSATIPRERFDRKVLAILKTPTAACMVFLAVAISVPSWPSGTWLPTYLYEKFGMSLTKSGLTMALFIYTPALAGSVLGGLWADLWAKRNLRGRMSVQILGLIFMAPTLLAVGFISSGRTLVDNLLLFSIARGSLEVNSMPVFSTVIAPSKWSTAYGLYNLAGTLSGSLGVLFVGVMKSTWGIGYALSSLSIVPFVAIGVLSLVWIRFLPQDIRTQNEESLPGIPGDEM
jgi:sugar phosphate permease